MPSWPRSPTRRRVRCRRSWAAAPAQLGPLLAEQVRQGNVFHGVHPGALLQLLRQDPVLAACTEAVETAPPWVWDIGGRHHAVCALRFRRRAGPAQVV